MIEYYWVCFASFAMGLAIAFAVHLWNQPVRRTFAIGSRVHFRGRPRLGEFRVLGSCVGTGAASGHALFVQRVIDGELVGVPGWHYEWELEPVYVAEACYP